MTSSRLILIFLAFIFLIIIILSSSRISAALRTRFGKMVPSLKPTTEEATPTPTIEMTTPTPTPTIVYGRGGKNGGMQRSGIPDTKSMPAAGPENLVWLVLAGSFFAGVTLKKITTKRS